MRFRIASENLALESCASTTFKPCKEKFYSSYMKVVTRSMLSLFTSNVLLYKIPIASWNPVLESFASTTFKPCKEKFYSSYMKVVTRSMLSLFTLKVLLYKIPIASGNLALESWASTTFKHCKDKFYSFIYESCKTFSAIFIHSGSFVIWCFQSRAGISCWNHALAQHSNLVKSNVFLRRWKL